MVPVDWRCSEARRVDGRLIASPWERPSCEVGRLESVSKARSSSIVSSTSSDGGDSSGEGMVLRVVGFGWVRSS